MSDLRDLADWLRRNPGTLPFTVADVCSYRGSYADLALVVGPGHIRTAALSKVLRSQIGKVHHGYKGGSYTMDERVSVAITRSHDRCGGYLTQARLQLLLDLPPGAERAAAVVHLLEGQGVGW